MKSIWTQSCDIINKNSLSKNIETEVAIIGAGLCGTLIAYMLREKGIDAVVLEADRIASGQTKNTTAKITSQHGLLYSELIKNFGEEKARQFACANQQAVEEYGLIITKNNINCDYEQKDAFLYSREKENTLRQEARAAAVLGLPSSFVPSSSKLPFEVTGMVKFENQAQFNPLRFINAIAKDLTIYEKTRVIKVEKDIITTLSQGADVAGKTSLPTSTNTVKAKHIIFACHYPFINFPGLYFTRMHQERSYVIALENALQVDGMYICAKEGGYSLRNFGNCLLFGGENHRTGENSGGGRYESLREKAKELFPNSKEILHWSAQDCMTADGVPYIGQYSSGTPNWYVATGFNKWGMTSSMVAATILSKMVIGIENKNAEIFSPSRFSASDISQIVGEGVQAVKGLVRETVHLPDAVVASMAVGHGGVVDMEGKKVGVFKESPEKIYIVDTRCPHLGCQLEWNPDEKSWDCPCHGSRFDYTGKLIDNPAQEDISIE